MYPLVLFFSINLLFFSWINTFHSLISFNTFEYFNNANHYVQDPRISDKPFSLINALGQYDGQWYLKIADKGYPDHPPSPLEGKVKVMDGLLYNFFPLYPLCIAFVNFFIHNVELSAFLMTNLILLASVLSLYFVVSQWYSGQIAIKTILLVLLFPFSIFLRGYFAEGLRLLLFIWFCYGLTQKNYLIAAISVGLSCVTSGISLFLLVFYYGVLLIAWNKKKVSLLKVLLYGAVAAAPFVLWMIFCYIHAGNALLFVQTRAAWDRPAIFPLFHNIYLILAFPWLPVRALYGSKIDVLCIVLAIALTALSKRVLPKIVWLATAVLAFSPLLVQDSISFARFVTVLFPLFIYLAVALKKNYYIMLVCFFILGLLFSSLYFINWYWFE